MKMVIISFAEFLGGFWLSMLANLISHRKQHFCPSKNKTNYFCSTCTTLMFEVADCHHNLVRTSIAAKAVRALLSDSTRKQI